MSSEKWLREFKMIIFNSRHFKIIYWNLNYFWSVTWKIIRLVFSSSSSVQLLRVGKLILKEVRTSFDNFNILPELAKDYANLNAPSLQALQRKVTGLHALLPETD